MGLGLCPVNRGGASGLHDHTPPGHLSSPPCADYVVTWTKSNSWNENSLLPVSNKKVKLHSPSTICSHARYEMEMKFCALRGRATGAVFLQTPVRFCSALCSLRWLILCSMFIEYFSFPLLVSVFLRVIMGSHGNC